MFKFDFNFPTTSVVKFTNTGSPYYAVELVSLCLSIEASCSTSQGIIWPNLLALHPNRTKLSIQGILSRLKINFTQCQNVIRYYCVHYEEINALNPPAPLFSNGFLLNMGILVMLRNSGLGSKIWKHVQIPKYESILKREFKPRTCIDLEPLTGVNGIVPVETAPTGLLLKQGRMYLSLGVRPREGDFPLYKQMEVRPKATTHSKVYTAPVAKVNPSYIKSLGYWSPPATFPISNEATQEVEDSLAPPRFRGKGLTFLVWKNKQGKGKVFPGLGETDLEQFGVFKQMEVIMALFDIGFVELLALLRDADVGTLVTNLKAARRWRQQITDIK